MSVVEATPWPVEIRANAAERTLSVEFDGGETFTGTMRYGTSTTWPNGEGQIGFRARRIADVPVYRLFLARTGDHLFTRDKGEAELRKGEGWADEGVAFTLYADAGPDRLPLHRLFSPSGACHAVTSDEEEAAKMAANGWVREGALGYVDTRGGVEIYVLHLRKGDTVIDVVATTNAGERDKLAAESWELRSSPGYGLP